MWLSPAPTHLIHMNGSLLGLMISWSFESSVLEQGHIWNMQGRDHHNEQNVHIALPRAQTLNLRHKGQVLTSPSYLQKEIPAGFAHSHLDDVKADFGLV